MIKTCYFDPRTRFEARLIIDTLSYVTVVVVVVVVVVEIDFNKQGGFLTCIY
jgi:hypothetical protein